MRIGFLGAFLLTAFSGSITAQQTCGFSDYQQKDPSVKALVNQVDGLIQQQLNNTEGVLNQQKGEHLFVITIPVVVHVLYHESSQNITQQDIDNQLKLLNDCYRRLNADTSNTPARFKSVAADCEIEFKLAITDPRKRSTTGVVRKYTPVTKWEADDKIKYSTEGGDDAWDPTNYLNIWVCNLTRMLGYSSFPGSAPALDGVVMNFSAFKSNKTLVHETGHYFGLKHLWGDVNCGDDLVDDTPKQSTFTSGCPSGIRLSCGGGANGDMYMNYMDFTNDACINMFTEGQKARMRNMFGPGGARSGLLTSYALTPPLISEIPLPEEEPKWFYANLYPNPASGEVTLDLSYDIRWVGKIITISTTQGQQVMQTTLNAKIMKLDISRLKPGVYFLSAKKEDGMSIRQKLVKL